MSHFFLSLKSELKSHFLGEVSFLDQWIWCRPLTIHDLANYFVLIFYSSFFNIVQFHKKRKPYLLHHHIASQRRAMGKYLRCGETVSVDQLKSCKETMVSTEHHEIHSFISLLIFFLMSVSPACLCTMWGLLVHLTAPTGQLGLHLSHLRGSEEWSPLPVDCNGLLPLSTESS